MRKKTNYFFIVSLLTAGILPTSLNAQVQQVTSFSVPVAKQGVAVDNTSFYVINNTSITKHDKQSGKQLDHFDGTGLGLKHMNAAIVRDGKLYCAHSNFPDLPMASSVEIFDTMTMKHLQTHSFGIDFGSLTWVDYKDGSWWAMFANYSKTDYPFPNNYTTLVRFSEDWQKQEGWVLPAELVKKFGTMSCSGGFWADNERIYITGHDLPELYVLRLPQMGSTLILEKTYDVPVPGQAIALDRSNNRKIIYGIDRDKKQVVRFELKN